MDTLRAEVGPLSPISGDSNRKIQSERWQAAASFGRHPEVIHGKVLCLQRSKAFGAGLPHSQPVWMDGDDAVTQRPDPPLVLCTTHPLISLIDAA